LKRRGRKLSDIGKAIILAASAYRDGDKDQETGYLVSETRFTRGKPRIRSRDVTATFDSFSSCFCLSVKSKYFRKRPVPKRRPSRPVEDHVSNHINLYYYEI
jgi:hypothetical protein